MTAPGAGGWGASRAQSNWSAGVDERRSFARSQPLARGCKQSAALEPWRSVGPASARGRRVSACPVLSRRPLVWIGASGWLADDNERRNGQPAGKTMMAAAKNDALAAAAADGGDDDDDDDDGDGDAKGLAGRK
jgi:hypothetical protein